MNDMCGGQKVECCGVEVSERSRGALDNAVIGEGTSGQFLSWQDLDEGSRCLPDLLYDAPSPAALVKHAGKQADSSNSNSPKGIGSGAQAALL